MSHQHQHLSTYWKEERRRTREENMVWIRIIILCMFISLLQAHKECTKHIKWGPLLQALQSMNVAISNNCAHYYEASLCNPLHLLNTNDYTANFLINVVKKTETMYREHPNPKEFIMVLQHTSNCVIHSGTTENESVNTCFNTFEAFLKNKSHSHCAWEIINSKVREILQRLENRSKRRRR